MADLAKLAGRRKSGHPHLFPHGDDSAHINRIIRFVIVLAVSLFLWCVPPSTLGLPDLTLVQQRMIAIFVFAALMWMFEIISSWSTSMIVVVVMLLTISDSSVWFMDKALGSQPMGTQVSYVSIMASFADPVIMLFIGGFILAIAATKSGLDVVLARIMLRPFGNQSRFVLLGFLLVTATFSMFISNTATAAMMLMFLTPVLKTLPADGKGKIGLALAIPIGANVGGMGTPIGTPPNAIALKYLNDVNGANLDIGFGQWVSVMFPYMLVILLLSWAVLLWLFPFKQKEIHLEIEGKMERNWRTWVVNITFAVTVLCWILDKAIGINANVVAMIPVGVFCATGIITKKDLQDINWSVLWMVAGGFALGTGLQDTGLAQHLIENIPFSSWSPVLMIVGSGLICWSLSNFISNTATAALLVPILAIVGRSMSTQLSAIGGEGTLLMGIAVSASLAMMLPISTPPNALAHATGMVRQRDMEKVGVLIGIVGLALGYAMLVVLGKNGFF